MGILGFFPFLSARAADTAKADRAPSPECRAFLAEIHQDEVLHVEDDYVVAHRGAFDEAVARGLLVSPGGAWSAGAELEWVFSSKGRKLASRR